MIPPFDINGYLPPGIHKATLVEIEKRYAYNHPRKWLLEGFIKLVRMLKSAGCKTVYLNGSYITNEENPRDYEAVWEYAGVDNTIDPLIRDELDRRTIKRKYSGDIFCRMPDCFDYVAYFQTDIFEISKGIIRIDLEKIDDKTHN